MLQLQPMEDFSFYEEEGCYFQDFKFHYDEEYFPDFSLEYLLEESPFFSIQHRLCTSTTAATRSYFWQEELGVLFQGDILSLWAALDEEARCKSEKELEQNLGRDVVEKTLTSNGPQNLQEKPLLTFELLSRHFCVPIKQAAAELKVGLTQLKRRCRELGIPRWPHRKMRSLQTLIDNVQELGRGTGEEGGMTKIVVEMLQQTKKLMEERPWDVELDHSTKMLRQKCFKKNYKRRRLMAFEG